MQPKPSHRRLQVFSLDPAADMQTETALTSRSVVQIPWEDLTTSPDLPARVGPGPMGEYLDVIDIDPSSNGFYAPVDLDQPSLLATDGLAPSTGNPQFHQQMVYAVGMKTITVFEQVLGRKVLWSERSRDERGDYLSDPAKRFVRRLRIYPHALREQNAYYSPLKKALLFGYFNAPTTDPRDELPGGLVFTCLSHDIIVHEMTHAILDGIHRRLLDVSNLDMLAFHEAFADIVAIFQHFTLPGLLLDQIQRTRGQLGNNSYLAKLAVQFARSTGRGSALRNALGEFDEEGRRLPPDPSAYGRTLEPHARGAILVAAVFDAFLRMYEDRVQDLRRIATAGTGILPQGAIHPDLARRFAEEAVRVAERILTICIRAVDYLPPVDITFGDYLRALITADADQNPNDPRRYRLAMIEAFRDRGIYPLDVRSLGEDALKWNRVDPWSFEWELIHQYMPPPNLLRTMAYGNWHPEAFDNNRAFFQSKSEAELLESTQELLSQAWTRLEPIERFSQSWYDVTDERMNRFLLEKSFSKILHHWITRKAEEAYRDLLHIPEELENRCRMVGRHLGIRLEDLVPDELYRHGHPDLGKPSAKRPPHRKSPLEVHSVRPTIRLRPDGHSKVQLLIILTQKQIVPVTDENGQEVKDGGGETLTFKYRGGCTLIIDPDLGFVEYAIAKNLGSLPRRERQNHFLREQVAQHGAAAITAFQLTETVRQEVRRGLRPVYEPLQAAHHHLGLRGGY